jgi:hypothetical protein
MLKWVEVKDRLNYRNKTTGKHGFILGNRVNTYSITCDAEENM